MSHWHAEVDCWYEHPKSKKRGKVRRTFIVESADYLGTDVGTQAEEAAKRGLCHTQHRRFIGVEFRECGKITLPYEIKARP